MSPGRSLIDELVPVVVVAPSDSIFDKTRQLSRSRRAAASWCC